MLWYMTRTMVDTSKGNLLRANIELHNSSVKCTWVFCFVFCLFCLFFFQWKGLFTLHAILCWHLTSTSKKQQKCLSYGLEWPLMFYLCLWIDPAPISMKYIEQEGMFPLDSDTRSSVHHTKLVLPSTPNLVTYNWQRKSHFSMGRRL